MTPANEMELKFDSRSANEGFARVAVAAYDAVESDGRGGCRCENRRVGSCDKRHYPRI